jgi:chromate transporter
MRAGYPGALAAWTAFTLPSALALVLFAFGVAALGEALGASWLQGLKVAAVAVVPRPCSA